MAFFKSIICCQSDNEIFTSINNLHLHGEHYTRYLKLLNEKRDSEITAELLKEASNEIGVRFEQLSDKYSALLDANEKKIPEESKGKIRTACGMSKLLVKEKLSQFNEFVATYESQANGEVPDPASGTKLVRLDDLRSFFEIISVQVTDLDSMFEEIRRLRDHAWNSVPELTVSDAESCLDKSRGSNKSTRLIIEAPPPTKNAQADLERRECQRAELRKMMRSQAADHSNKDDDEDITIAIYEGKKTD